MSAHLNLEVMNSMVLLDSQLMLQTLFKDVQYRSSHQKVTVEKGVLRNFMKFTGKQLCVSFFFKKETLTQVFFFNFVCIRHLPLSLFFFGKLITKY